MMGNMPAPHRKHQGIAANPPRDCLETTEGRRIGLNGADERLDIVATEEAKGLGSLHDRRDLPKGGRKRPNTTIGEVTHSNVDHKEADECRGELWRQQCQTEQQDRCGSENRK